MAEAVLKLTTDTAEAIKGIERFQKDAAKSLKAVEKAFDALKITAVAAIGAVVFNKLVDGLGDVVEAAEDVEKATFDLAKQLRLTGEFSDDAVKGFQDYADELERTTNLSDDVVLGQLAVAKSFGVTNDQAKKLVSAAADLAAATGMSLDGAVQQLGKSLSGVKGKLDEQIPAVAALTKEQLLNGEAIRLVSERYGGSALVSADNFSGAVRLLTVEWGNLKEAIGGAIIDSPALVAAVNAMSTALRKLGDNISNASGDADLLKAPLLVIASTAGAAAEGIGKLVKALDLLIAGSYYTPIVALGRGLAGLVEWFEGDSFKGLGGKLKTEASALDKYDGAVSSVRESLQDLASGSQSAADFFDELGVKIAEATKAEGDSASASKNASASRRRDIAAESDAREAAKRKADELKKSLEEYLDTKAKAGSDLVRSLKEIPEALSQDVDKQIAAIPAKLEEALKASVQRISQNPIELAFVADISSPEVAAAGAGLIAKMLDGAAGAKSLITSAAAGIGEALLPGLGPVIGGIVGKLTEGPDATKQFVREFAAALPDMIVAIGEAAPAFVEAAVDAFINKGGAVKVGVAIMRAMAGEGTAKAIGKQIGLEFGSAFNSSNIAQTIAAGFAIGSQQVRLAFSQAIPSLNQFVTNLQNAGFAFGQAFSETLKALPALIALQFQQGAAEFAAQVRAILGEAASVIASGFVVARDAGVELFNGFIGALQAAGEQIREILTPNIPGVTKGAGSGGGLVPDSVPVFGKLATGGTVPAGFPNDSFSAGLTSGEMVVPGDDVIRLSKFLDEQAAGAGASDGVIAALLAQILGALNQPMQVSTTATVNGNALADIILNLSRRNARLTA